MPLFLFQPDQEVVVRSNAPMGDYPPMSFIYNSNEDRWFVKDPKTNNWIVYMQEGVPEYYKAQMLLLIAAYPD